MNPRPPFRDPGPRGHRRGPDPGQRGLTVKRIATFLVIFLAAGTLGMFPSRAFCESPSLARGIEQYRLENYTEAIRLLEEARREDPGSSASAFFLGLAYKQLMDFPKALSNLRDAVTLAPRIKEALVELIEVLYEVYEKGNLEEAKGWIALAEKENIFPAKIAFLKGLILLKAGENREAVAAFERAKTLDKNLAQPADIQIAMGYMNEMALEKAREKFKAAVQYDPQSDLAAFARRYQDMVEKRLEMERPFRFTLGVFGQYDTNVVLKPSDSSLAPDITGEGSRLMANTFQVDYVPKLDGPWLFNAQYAFYNTLHDRFSTSHDIIANSILLAPGYGFGTSALNLSLRYSHSMVRGPSYKKYLQSLNVGPLYRRLLPNNQIMELFAGYRVEEYFQPPLVPEEDRDSEGLDAYLSWIWLFRPGAFFNLKYEFIDRDTDGMNWENHGHRFSLNLALPLREKLQLQLGGEAFFEDYGITHTVFGVDREDSSYTGLAGLAWEFRKNTTLVLQYTHTRADSNVAIYDYERELYSLGIEYRF